MSELATTLARRRVGQNARLLRIRLGITQEQAAEQIGCSVQALQRMERATAAVTIDFLAHVAAAYRSDLADLVSPIGPWRVPVPGRPPAGDPGFADVRSALVSRAAESGVRAPPPGDVSRPRQGARRLRRSR